MRSRLRSRPAEKSHSRHIFRLCRAISRRSVWEHVFVNSNEKGAIAEMAIAFHAVELGLGVLKPLSERQRYDLGLEVGGRLFRVQCKWGHVDGDVIKARLGTSRYTPNGYVRTNYTRDDVDAFAVYCRELSECYLIPISEADGKSYIHLRLRSARNGQVAGLNFAADFTLAGAVAQLEERRYGIPEAGGSSPPAPLPQRLSSSSSISVPTSSAVASAGTCSERRPARRSG